MKQSSFFVYSASVALLSLTCATRLAGQDPDGGKEDAKGREEYFWAQRMYPSTERPYEQMQRAMSQASAMLLRRSNSATANFVAGGWRSLGPSGIFMSDNGFFSSGPMLDAGRVTTVAPAGGAVYIGTASGGVWRSAGGGPWTPLTDNQCNLNVGAVTVDAADPNVVYAGTGEYNQNTWGCGILRSTDGGATWTQLGASSFRVTRGGIPNGDASFGKLIVNRPGGGSVGNTVIIGATNVGVFQSADGGATWNFVLTGATASLVAHPTTPGEVFAGNSDNFTASRRGVYKSIDNGATWSALPALPGIDPSNIQRIELAISPVLPNLVYALIGGQDFKFLGLFVWNDLAQTWTQLPAAGLYTGAARGDFGGQTWYDLAIALDPVKPDRIYVAGLRGFRSTDGGATFTQMATQIHCDWHSIAIDPANPDILYAGTDGGAFVSTDRGDSWSSRNEGLTIAQYYPGISASPNGAVVLGGSQDNGTHLFTGSTFWNGVFGGDGGYTAINYSNTSVRYFETPWDASGVTLIRFDGSTSTNRRNGIVATDRHAFIPPYLIDPVTPTTLYLGSHRLYKTTDEGATWAPLSGDLTKGSGYIMAIAVSKADPRTIYVGASDGMVNVTRDGGATFTQIATGLPNRTVTDIEIDPTDPTHALLTVSGFTSGHVFETKNAGALWTDISTGLIDAPANAIAFVPGVGLMVGTDVGVFQTSAPGSAWTAGPAGIPNVIINDLINVPAAGMVLAGTYGRGMFAYSPGGEAAVLRGDVNGDGTVDAFDALLIQQSLVGSLTNTTVVYPRGDADCNQAVQTADAVLVLRTAVGIATPGACVNTVR